MRTRRNVVAAASGTAQTVDELLPCAGWCYVFFDLVIDEMEPWSELLMEGVNVVADDFKATTLLRPLRAEGCHDDVATGLHCAGDLPHVRLALAGLGEKMKDSPIVPQVVNVGLERIRRHVSLQAAD